MRLDKLLAHTGYGTRKEVKEIIKNGYVMVNGVAITSDKFQVDPNKDTVRVDGEIIEYSEFVYYMLNKPQGYISATEDQHYPTVIDLIDDYHIDLFPVGRLDIDTEGLLIITNDGKLAHELTSPKKKCPKVYYAVVSGIVNDDDIQAFYNGITIDTGYHCMSALLNIINIHENNSEVEVTIYEGKYHQVKKMFEAVGKHVDYLKRIQMKNLKLDPNLQTGEYKKLNKSDLNRLF